MSPHTTSTRSAPHAWSYDEVAAILSSASADEVVVEVATSGSTGTPKVARLTAGAITASARATLDVLGGPGRWLLATPTTHIAGIQVLVRSVLAGVRPVTVEGRFTVTSFAAAVAQLGEQRRYAALVPTQVRRLLDRPEGRSALAGLDTVLVGGAAVPATLRAEAKDVGAHLVATYGMSETAGGCVYDGRPLPVTRMRIADPDAHGVGVIELSGATLALGYADRPAQSATAFRTEPDGSRWFRTDDLGSIDAGVLTVLGRRDDVINTGGLKVAPAVVEEAVSTAYPQLADRCVVVGLPDPLWGEAVTLVVAAAPAPALEQVRARLRPLLPPTALPTRVETVERIPRLGPGKPDRRSVRALVSSRATGR
ncbi:MAG: o-succinylbenzoate--CoA ligase [Dermatophilaceae bacterium]